MKKTVAFNEKICITASSQNVAHRAPVKLVMRRGVIWTIAAVMVAVLAFCIYTAVDAANTVRELDSQIETLGKTLEAQSSELTKYEQQLDEPEQALPSS